MPPLILARDALVKVGKHAWNVYPLQAFGYLLGREDGIHAALPFSKTHRWHEYADRWNGIAEHAAAAGEFARGFGMHLAGFYASGEQVRDPGEPWPGAGDDHVILEYNLLCCPACSTASPWVRGRSLTRGEEWRVPHGRRIDRAVSQRRILAAWRERTGPIDYTNGYVRPDAPAAP